jgi:hypothetical protein
MPDALRTATPPGDWRSFKFTCDDSGGFDGIMDAVNNDAVGARRSSMRLIQDAVGLVLETVAFGDEAVLIYHAEKTMVPKMLESGDVFLPGDRVYWDPAVRLVTPTYDSAFYWIGMATEPADADDLRVEIDLKGDHAETELVLP